MEQQIPPSMPAEQPGLPQISPEQLERLKAIARERAIAMQLEQNANQSVTPPPSRVPPQVVYVRRNLTVAELLLLILLACGLVGGTQALWHYGSRLLPQIEVKVK